MSIRTHYDNLKISRNATQQEIKRAYRKLCSIHHPDKYPDKDKAKQTKILSIINEAYRVLSNDTLRAEHNLWIDSNTPVKETTNRRQPHNQQQAYTRTTQTSQEEVDWRKHMEELRKQYDLRENESKYKEQSNQGGPTFTVPPRRKRKIKGPLILITVGLLVAQVLLLFGYFWLTHEDKQTGTTASQKFELMYNERLAEDKYFDGPVARIKSKANGFSITYDVYMEKSLINFNEVTERERVRGIGRRDVTCTDHRFAILPLSYTFIYHYQQEGKQLTLDISKAHFCGTN